MEDQQPLVEIEYEPHATILTILRDYLMDQAAIDNLRDTIDPIIISSKIGKNKYQKLHPIGFGNLSKIHNTPSIIIVVIRALPNDAVLFLITFILSNFFRIKDCLRGTKI